MGQNRRKEASDWVSTRKEGLGGKREKCKYVLVGLKNGASLNLIQTWFIFLPLKMAKAIYSNSAYLQELILILILASTFSMLSVLFCIFFLSEGIQKKREAALRSREQAQQHAA